MQRVATRSVLAALVGLGLATWATAGPIVQKAELVEPSATGIKLVLTLSGTVTEQVFQLEKPARLVVDLRGARQASNLRLPAPAGPVKSLRSGMQADRDLRLVLELSAPMPQRVTRSGQQLVIQLGVDPVAAQPAPAPASAVRAVHAPADSGRDVVIAIDAGHGGQDPGATGKAGTREKDVVLSIARALARRINAEPGMRAVLTRNEDRFVPLRDRTDAARTARADIFVSIHADAIRNRAVSGSSVYVLSERGASSEAALWLAEQENAADLKGGVSLGDKDNQLASVLMDLSQTASIGSSMQAAERVLSQLDRVGAVRKTQVQQAGFVVLKSPDIPSMLIETAYISNPAEEKRLRSAAHQNAVAEAIFRGVVDHFRTSPPDGTLFARQRDLRRGLSIVSSTAGS